MFFSLYQKLNFVYLAGIFFTFLFLFPFTTHAALTDGLVGHWTFDGRNLTTATATDSSGNGNNGTFTNTTGIVSATTGKIGQAVKFNTSTSEPRIVIPYNSSLDSSNSGGSIASWFKLNSDIGTTVGQQTIYRWQYHPNTANTGGINYGVSSGVGLPYYLSFQYSSTTNLVTATTTRLRGSTWYLGVVTWNGSTIKMYVNGNEVASVAQTGTMTWGNNAGGCIGSSCSGSGSYMEFPGNIDDLRIYNRTLSAAEAAQLYKQGQTTQASPTKVSTSTATTGLGGGLVGHWTFDGNKLTTATATDSSGLGNNGTLGNSPKPVIGKLGQGLDFNGFASSASNVSVSNNTALQFSGTATITLSTWVYPKQVSSFGTFLVKGRGSADTQANYALRQGTTGKTLEFYYNDSGGLAWQVWSSSANVFPVANKWYHVTVTYTFGTASSIKAYIDGRQISGSWTNGTGSVTADVDTQPVTLGWKSNTSISNEPFKGTLDDVRIYNRALSATEVAQLYRQGQTSTAVPLTKVSTSTATTSLGGGLIGHWTFDGRNLTTATATDLSGLGNNGTLVNGPKPTIGKIGQGISFDGVDDAVSVPVNLASINKVSLSFWMKWDQFSDNDDIAFEYTPNFNTVNGFIISPNSSSGKIGIYNSCVSAYNGGTFNRPSSGAWHHYVITFNRSGSTALQTTAVVDGVPQTVTLTNASACSGNYSNSTLYIMSRGAASLFGAGKLDDVRLYNRLLTTTEALQLYKTGTITVR